MSDLYFYKALLFALPGILALGFGWAVVLAGFDILQNTPDAPQELKVKVWLVMFVPLAVCSVPAFFAFRKMKRELVKGWRQFA